MKARIYCIRIAHYYGFGVTPEAAVQALPTESPNAERILAELLDAGAARGKDQYLMHELPEGISDCFVDDFGGLQWRFPDWVPEDRAEAQAKRLYYDPAKREWVPEPVKYTPPEGEAKDDRDFGIVEATYSMITRELEAYLSKKSVVNLDSKIVKDHLKEMVDAIRTNLEDMGASL